MYQITGNSEIDDGHLTLMQIMGSIERMVFTGQDINGLWADFLVALSLHNYLEEPYIHKYLILEEAKNHLEAHNKLLAEARSLSGFQDDRRIKNLFASLREHQYGKSEALLISAIRGTTQL